MDIYKKKITHRINLLSLAALGLAAIYCGLFFYRDHLPVLPSFIKGFNQGAFIGLEVIIAFYLGSLMKVRNNDAALKKMHVEENDERKGLILQKAGVLSIVLIFFGLGMATIVSGFFNATVFFTLVSTLLAILIVFYTLWMYYARKL